MNIDDQEVQPCCNKGTRLRLYSILGVEMEILNKHSSYNSKTLEITCCSGGCSGCSSRGGCGYCLLSSPGASSFAPSLNLNFDLEHRN